MGWGPCDHRGQTEDAAHRPGAPGVPGRGGKFPPLEPLEGAGPWRHLEFGLWGPGPRESQVSSPATACGAVSRQPRGTNSSVTPAPAFSAGGRVEPTHVMGFCENQIRTAHTGCVVVTDSGVDVLNRQHPQVLTKHGRLIFVTTQGAGVGGCHCALFTGGQPEAYSQGPGPAGGGGEGEGSTHGIRTQRSRVQHLSRAPAPPPARSSATELGVLGRLEGSLEAGRGSQLVCWEHVPRAGPGVGNPGPVSSPTTVWWVPLVRALAPSSWRERGPGLVTSEWPGHRCRATLGCLGASPAACARGGTVPGRGARSPRPGIPYPRPRAQPGDRPAERPHGVGSSELTEARLGQRSRVPAAVY